MIHHGDLFDVLPTFEADSIDAGVTDPPYGIGFMGREWDTFKPSAMKDSDKFHQVDRARVNHPNPNLRNRTRSPALSPSQIAYDYSTKGLRAFQEWTERWAREVLRVLKPGAHLVVCGAPRSYHRMACGIEDAGFEMRDSVSFLLDVSELFRDLVESLTGEQRKALLHVLASYDGVLSWVFAQGFPKSKNLGRGWGTALKPAYEPIVLARKPFKGSTTANVERYGVGGIHVDGCRIEDDGLGRWPANLLLDEAAAAMLDEQSGELTSGHNPTRRNCDKTRNIYGAFKGATECEPARGLSIGGASRFYYVAKPSREERDLGCDHLPERSGGEATHRKDGSAGLNNPRAGAGRTGGGRNIHPTVKPLALMRWLVRLVTPPGGRVLDPFTGSGTTGMACAAEGVEFVGIEREAEYIPIIEARIRSIAPLFAGG